MKKCVICYFVFDFSERGVSGGKGFKKGKDAQNSDICIYQDIPLGHCLFSFVQGVRRVSAR